MLNIFLNLILLFVCKIQAMENDVIPSAFVTKEMQTDLDERRHVCAGLFNAPHSQCNIDHSVIKIVNRSGMDVIIKVTYGHFKSQHMICTTDKYLKPQKNKDDYYCPCGNGYEVAYKVLKLEGTPIIIAKNEEIIIKPQNILKNSELWTPEQMPCIVEIYAKPIIHGPFSKIRSYLKSCTLINVEKIHANVFNILLFDDEGLFILHDPELKQID
ncbi:hypothetical protein M1446_02640 [Candidatus Dependentiae bacterium]|nr:hypothetical protein [Candidatus Dependentiae bacterium]